jgi:hypothetical protein
MASGACLCDAVSFVIERPPPAFDGPTGTRLATHIFVADNSDYYEIADGLPKNQQ